VNYINSLQADAKHSNRSKFNREKLENITKALRRSRKSQKKAEQQTQLLLNFCHTNTYSADEKSQVKK